MKIVRTRNTSMSSQCNGQPYLHARNLNEKVGIRPARSITQASQPMGFLPSGPIYIDRALPWMRWAHPSNPLRLQVYESEAGCLAKRECQPIAANANNAANWRAIMRSNHKQGLFHAQ